jgi:hypothetical protein
VRHISTPPGHINMNSSPVQINRVKTFSRFLEKLRKYVDIISDFQKRKNIIFREKQSLVAGLLNFECSVIIPGRAFLLRLIDLTHSMHPIISSPH